MIVPSLLLEVFIGMAFGCPHNKPRFPQHSPEFIERKVSVQGAP